MQAQKAIPGCVSTKELNQRKSRCSRWIRIEGAKRRPTLRILVFHQHSASIALWGRVWCECLKIESKSKLSEIGWQTNDKSNADCLKKKTIHLSLCTLRGRLMKLISHPRSKHWLGYRSAIGCKRTSHRGPLIWLRSGRTLEITF